MSLLSKTLILTISIFVVGCNAYLTNLSPNNFKPRTGDQYTICANVTAESLVLRQSINVTVTTDSQKYQMQGSGTGKWSYNRYAPAVNSFDYYYDLKWKYLFGFLIPVSNHRRYPSTGSYHSSVSMPAGCSNDGWCLENSGTMNNLKDVWGSGPNDVFAVGWSDEFLHYNGNTWVVQSSSVGSPAVSIEGVWGSGPSHNNDVFAVGFAGVVLAHREPSTSWTVWYSGSDPSTNVEIWAGELNDLWGSDSSDIFIVSEAGKISHYNGSNWLFQSSGTTIDLMGVWGSGPSDVFAVADRGTILHFNGSSWNSQNSGTSNCLRGVWGSSPTDVFAVGCQGTILHYDGATWTSHNSNTNEWLWSVWGCSPADVYAVGAHGTILHYDGSTWSSQDSGIQTTLRGVWGTNCGCEPMVYAVGEYGIILRK